MMTEPTPKPMIDQPIRVQGDWKEEDFLLAHQLAYPLTTGKKLSLVAVGLFMFGAGCGCVLFMPGVQSYVVGGFMMFMAFVVSLGGIWFPPFMARGEVKKAMKASRGCDVQLLTKGYRWLDMQEPVTRPWAKWYSIILHPDVIVLFELKRKYEILPRRLFESQADYDLVQQVIKASTREVHEFDAEGNKIQKG